jgi:chemotaxis protein MotA
MRTKGFAAFSDTVVRTAATGLVAGRRRQYTRRALPVDIATLVGLIGGFGIIIGAIATGGDIMLFVNIPSILIVVGGTFMVTLMQVSLGDFLGSFAIGLKAFLYKVDDPKTLIEEAVGLADVARKNGLLALEGQEISNEFMKKGINLCVDGHDPALVQKMLGKDIDLTIQRHEVGQRMFRNMAVMAPAMGMIGTLIGLVQMLANMSDPSAIGPAMAVALLTTLYGAIIANAFAQPMANKLGRASELERTNKSLIIETISGIQEGMNPKVLEQMLGTYLPPAKRLEEA